MLPIIMDIKNEDDRLFVETLYNQYSKKMYLIAYDILKNCCDAEDCVHDTIVLIIKNLERFQNAENNYLKRLIVICCRNVAFGMYHMKKRKSVLSLTHSAYPGQDDDDDREEIEIIDESADVEKIVINEHNAEIIHRLVEQLDTKYRDAVVLRYYYSLTYKEISDITKVPEATVRMRISRAKRKLMEWGGELIV